MAVKMESFAPPVPLRVKNIFYVDDSDRFRQRDVGAECANLNTPVTNGWLLPEIVIGPMPR